MECDSRTRRAKMLRESNSKIDWSISFQHRDPLLSDSVPLSLLSSPFSPPLSTRHSPSALFFFSFPSRTHCGINLIRQCRLLKKKSLLSLPIQSEYLSVKKARSSLWCQDASLTSVTCFHNNRKSSKVMTHTPYIGKEPFLDLEMC